MKDFSLEFVESLLTKLSAKAMDLSMRLIFALIILIIGMKLIKTFMKFLRKVMDNVEADMAVEQFLLSFIRALLYVLLAFTIAANCGMDAASIVAVLGSAGVAIGLALQGSLSNLAGGVLILLLRPFNIGDYIVDAAGNEGVVDEIQIFYTKLHTGDNRVIVLPNGNLANNSIINVTASKFRRCDITVGISYDSDIRLAKKVLTELLENDPKTIKDMEMLVYVSQLADSSVNLGVRCWYKKEDYFPGMWNLNEEIKYALDEAGISIPYPQLDIHVKNPSE